MKKSSVLTIVGLLTFCVVVFLPPIIYGYVYPNVGDDTAAHLVVFDKIKAGTYGNVPFIVSYRLVGYPIVWLSNLFGVSTDVLFLWFSYASLALIGLIMYFVVSQLIGRRAGWLSLVIVLFGAQGILFQFYFGQIFNAVNIGLIFPLALFFGLRYLAQGKAYQLVFALFFGGLFGAFHTSGIYLPFVSALALGVYVAYSLLRRKGIVRRPIWLGGGVILLSSVGFLLSIPNTGDLWEATIHGVRQEIEIPMGDYLMGIVSPTVLVIVVFALMNIKDIWKRMSANDRGVVVVLTCFIIVLGVASFTKLSLDPFRQALDMATILALLVAVLMGSFVWTRKNQVAMVIVFLAIGFGLWHNLPAWFDYNSAIRSADKEAIAYVNSLSYGGYNTSAEVAPWIYDRFTILAKYKKDVASILIVRDKPMTPRSDPKNKWYEGHGLDVENYTPIYGNDRFEDDYNLLKIFNDGKVTVRVYENVGNAYYLPLERP